MSLNEGWADERLVIELDHGAAHIASAINRVPTSPLRDQLTTVNILLADVRAAVLMIKGGADKNEVFGVLAEKARTGQQRGS